jgi:4a-hydroxytetrahydrobiopterin dehydratase
LLGVSWEVSVRGEQELTGLVPDDVSARALSAMDGLDAWRLVLGCLRATFGAAAPAEAARLATAVVDAAETAGASAAVCVHSSGEVSVVLPDPARGGRLRVADVVAARAISRRAHEAGAAARPTAPQALEIAVDTTDAVRIRPFWAAVLGYRDEGGVLVDPRGSGPAVWFQDAAAPRPGRGRLHLDVSVPHDLAHARVAAGLAAGGRLVSDAHARAWWVLADADGNEACVSTWLDRPGGP